MDGIDQDLSLKKRVPNISEKSGVSRDYLLAFGSVENYLERIERKEEPRWIKLATNTLLHRPILRYSQFFDPSEYDQVVTNHNDGLIKQLDEIVDRVNLMREQGQVNYGELTSIWKRVNELVLP